MGETDGRDRIRKCHTSLPIPAYQACMDASVKEMWRKFTTFRAGRAGCPRPSDVLERDSQTESERERERAGETGARFVRIALSRCVDYSVFFMLLPKCLLCPTSTCITMRLTDELTDHVCM